MFTTIVTCFLLAQNTVPTDAASPDMETVRIEGTTFTMGTPIRRTGDAQYHADEKPVKVTVEDFRIGKYPVTAEQMCAFLNSPVAQDHDPEELYCHKNMDAVGSGNVLKYSTITFEDGRFIPRPGAAKAPTNQVTWKGAVLFCEWLSEETGKYFRLPTEAEWELAARGVQGREWPWGGENATAKHGERYTDAVDRRTWTTTPVGSHPANVTPEGVQDFLAYVIGEWCTNKYIEHPTSAQANDKAIDLDDLDTRRVVRGYYHRVENQETTNKILAFLRMGSAGYHLGRPWTRIAFDPMEAPQHGARFGFRVVEEIVNE